MSGSPTPPADPDLEALLVLALEEEPSDGMAERVLARVAAMRAAVDFVTLVLGAPLEALAATEQSSDPPGDADDADG